MRGYLSIEIMLFYYFSFPATCPYITAVGSTAILGSVSGLHISKRDRNTPPPICSLYNCTSTPAKEVPAVTDNSNFTSGGGLSAVYSQPAYQTQAVKNYLSLPLSFPTPAIWNATNRAIPDVAVVGQNILVVNGSKTWVLGGTSASAPLFAGILSLINDFLLQNDKPPIGFANVLLYQMAGSNSPLKKGHDMEKLTFVHQRSVHNATTNSEKHP